MRDERRKEEANGFALGWTKREETEERCEWNLEKLRDINGTLCYHLYFVIYSFFLFFFYIIGSL